MMIIDTHTHYDDERFQDDRDEILSSLHAQGIGAVVNVGSTWESLAATQSLGRQYGCVYTAYGIHPDEAGCLTEGRIEELRQLCREDKKCVAVGEIGLDYHWMTEPKEVQEHWFRAQLALAREERLPAIIHSRDAAEDTLRICREEDLDAIGGVMHCFSYEKEIAREYLNMGIYLGIGGVATFRNGRKLKEVIACAPMEQLVLETDCPYLAPEPHRGKRNDSRYLPLVVHAIAEIRGLTDREVVTATAANAKRLFRLGDT